MRAPLVRIGDAKVLLIPRTVLERSGFGREVELRAEAGRLVVLPVAEARAGRDEAFARAGTAADRPSLVPDGLRSRFEEESWTW